MPYEVAGNAGDGMLEMGLSDGMGGGEGMSLVDKVKCAVVTCFVFGVIFVIVGISKLASSTTDSRGALLAEWSTAENNWASNGAASFKALQYTTSSSSASSSASCADVSSSCAALLSKKSATNSSNSTNCTTVSSASMCSTLLKKHPCNFAPKKDVMYSGYKANMTLAYYCPSNCSASCNSTSSSSKSAVSYSCSNSTFNNMCKKTCKSCSNSSGSSVTGTKSLTGVSGQFTPAQLGEKSWDDKKVSTPSPLTTYKYTGTASCPGKTGSWPRSGQTPSCTVTLTAKDGSKLTKAFPNGAAQQVGPTLTHLKAYPCQWWDAGNPMATVGMGPCAQPSPSGHGPAGPTCAMEQYLDSRGCPNDVITSYFTTSRPAWFGRMYSNLIASRQKRFTYENGKCWDCASSPRPAPSARARAHAYARVHHPQCAPCAA